MNRSPGVLLAFLLVLSILGCGSTHTPKLRADPHGSVVQHGQASWYGKPFHGRRTASGERYDMHARTAAHRKLPFGTRVRVTNLENGKETVVRINDRGPFVQGRVIDLSFGAASQIQMVQAGVVKVRLEILGGP
jgi:rare lipoprotein A